jgi:ABC-type histidine transport system ATPase subunit
MCQYSYLLVTLPGLSRRISSLVGIRGVLGSAGAFVTLFLGCLRFLDNPRKYKKIITNELINVQRQCLQQKN